MPRPPVLACGIPDPRLAPCLAGVPHAVEAAMFDDGRTVDVTLPVGLVVGSEDDDRPGPGDAVRALHQGDALLRPPREPHAIGAALPEDGDVEAGPEVAAEHRALRGLRPPGGRLGRRWPLGS